MSSNLPRTIAIVGAAESDELGAVLNKSALQHHAEAAHNALADADLRIVRLNDGSEREIGPGREFAWRPPGG